MLSTSLCIATLDMRQESFPLSTKLLSLLGSASSIMKDHKRDQDRPTSSFRRLPSDQNEAVEPLPGDAENQNMECSVRDGGI